MNKYTGKLVAVLYNTELGRDVVITAPHTVTASTEISAIKQGIDDAKKTFPKKQGFGGHFFELDEEDL